MRKKINWLLIFLQGKKKFENDQNDNTQTKHELKTIITIDLKRENNFTEEDNILPKRQLITLMTEMQNSTQKLTKLLINTLRKSKTIWNVELLSKN